MKTVFGILNWNRDITQILESLGQNDVIVSTNKDVNFAQSISTLKADPNIAKSKNDIIKAARECGYDYLVLMEDDISIIDPAATTQRYIEAMKRFGLGLMFYSYHKGNNCVMDGVKNTGIITKISEEEELHFCRFPCGAFMVIDLVNNQELFDEDLVCLELEEYCQRCANEKIVPFNGFFLDLPDSETLFRVTDRTKNRIKTKEAVDLDKKSLGEKKLELKLASNADELINWIVEKLKNPISGAPAL